MAAAAAVATGDARYKAQQRAALWVDVMGVGLNAALPGHHAQLEVLDSVSLPLLPPFCPFLLSPSYLFLSPSFFSAPLYISLFTVSLTRS